MYCPAILCIGAWPFAGAGRDSASETDFRAFEFRPALYRFRAISTHSIPFTAYWDAVIVNGEIILVDGRSATFAVEVNEWRNAVAAAVFLINHCVMGGIQQELVHVCFRQELFHGVPVIKKPEGIMP